MKLDAAVQIAALKFQAQQERTLSFAGGDGWAAKLSLGQIIKGKVLRSYGDGRYSVEFGGQQRIVDSSVPLSPGEQLRGRVVGLAECVTIERLPERNLSAVPSEETPPWLTPSGQGAEAVRAAADRLQIRINAHDAELVAGVARKVSDSTLAIRTGLFLAKLGLPVSAELVRALYERVSASPSAIRASLAKYAPLLAAENGLGTEPNPAVEDACINGLAQCLADDCRPEGDRTPDARDAAAQAETRPPATVPGFASSPDPDQDEAGGSSDADRERRLAAILAGTLNVQTGGSLQHRFRTLPVVIGGRLVEFDLALFDHVPAADNGVHTRRLHFSLSTDQGPLDVDATAIDDHVQIVFSGAQSRLLDALETHAGDLAQGLRQRGWQLDGAQYRYADGSPPALSIVDHVLAQDSLRMSV